MIRKTFASFLKQAREDDEFRAYVSRLSPTQLGRWLRAEFGGKVDGARLMAELWSCFPDKPFVEILETRAAFEADPTSQERRRWPSRERLAASDDDLDQAVSRLAAMLDPDAALGVLRMYNMGLSQMVQIPTGSGFVREVRLERADRPKVSELRDGAAKRLARLLVEAAREHGVQARRTLR